MTDQESIDQYWQEEDNKVAALVAAHPSLAHKECDVCGRWLYRYGTRTATHPCYVCGAESYCLGCRQASGFNVPDDIVEDYPNHVILIQHCSNEACNVTCYDKYMANRDTPHVSATIEVNNY